MKSCTVISAGDIGQRDKLLNYIDDNRYIICADGGYDNAVRIGAVPQLVVGDMDSITASSFACEIIKAQPEKDDTDTILAIKTAIARGYDDIVILGGLGGRLDHVYANLQTLLYCEERGVNALLVGSRDMAFAVKERTAEVPRAESKYISVFAADSVCLGVTLRGVKYPLTEATVTKDFPIGVSNEFAAETAKITVKKGMLLVIISDK